MTYYPDLSPYTYSHTPHGRDLVALNIGWLSNAVPYPTGETSDEFKEKLLTFCFRENVVLVMRGFHACEFCDNQGSVREVRRGDRVAFLGTGEIRVIGESAIYAAPTLVYHYVTAHQYRPPEEFVEAVLTGPPPDSEEHRLLRRKLGGHWYGTGNTEPPGRS